MHYRAHNGHEFVLSCKSEYLPTKVHRRMHHKCDKEINPKSKRNCRNAIGKESEGM